MDAKLNHSDLSALLAKAADISGAKAELFTKAMFDIIIEGLEKDGLVKINGLGTFKVAEVASRSSVNVNTGEKFEIKGHRKLTFTPADTLKDDVNQPFAMFEPVEVDETYKEEEETEIPETDADAEEDAATVAETAASISSVEPEVTEEPSGNVVPEEEAEAEEIAATIETEPDFVLPDEEEIPADEPAVAEHAATGIVEEEQPLEEEPAPVTVVHTTEEEKQPEPVAEETAAVETEESAYVKTEKEIAPGPAEEAIAIEPENTGAQANMGNIAQDKQEAAIPAESAPTSETPKIKKGSTAWIYAVLMLVVLAGGASVLMLDGKKESEPVRVETKKTASVTEQVAEPLAEIVPAVNDSIPAIGNDTVPAVADIVPQPEEEYRFVLCEELASKSIKSISMADTTLYVADGDITVHKVTDGDRLTRIAMKYYGDKKLWPYIVKHNRLADPNGLCKGMELAIPKLKARN